MTEATDIAVTDLTITDLAVTDLAVTDLATTNAPVVPLAEVVVPEGHGLMSTLDKTGDTRVMWDRRNKAEVDAAKAQFEALTKAGYMAYKAEGKEGTQGAQIRRFDPDAERIIMVKPLVGG